MVLTLEEAKRRMEANGGSLYLGGCTGLTSLPEGLTVGGDLYLSGCAGLTSLPEGLTVGGWLDLSGCTGLASLPEGLTVGGSMALGGCTGLTSLPEGLTVGGSLAMCGCTGLTSLPEGLTVGGSLDLSWTNIPSSAKKKVHKLRDGDYVEGKYLYADYILTHIKKRRTVGQYTLYEGKIPGRNVVSDGVRYAHCDTFRNGKEDLDFKAASDRGADQYRGLPLNTRMKVPALKTMYRVITGACQQGTEQFIASLGDRLKDEYTIAEVIELTRDQYGGKQFERFFTAA